MSLLDNGTDLVIVYPEKVGTDALGNPGHLIPDMDAGVEVYGDLQWGSSTESNSLGQQVRTQRVFITRSFPAGAFAVLKDPDDHLWDIVGEPARRNRSAATSHATVTLQKRPAKPSPATTTGEA